MSDTLGSAMRELWDEWQPQELQRVANLEAAVQVIADGRLTEIERHDAKEEAHRLAGSLAALGCTEGSRCARELERRLVIVPDPHHADGLHALVASLRAAVERCHR